MNHGARFSQQAALSSSSSVWVSTASAFHFVSRTVCSSYLTLNLRRPSFSSRRCTDLEQSSAAYHICSITSCLLLSLEDILLRTLLPVITVVVPAKSLSFMDWSNILRVSAMSAFSKPYSSETAGPRSMKLGKYTLCVLGQNIYEAKFWISAPALCRVTANLARSGEIIYPEQRAYYLLAKKLYIKGSLLQLTWFGPGTVPGGSGIAGYITGMPRGPYGIPGLQCICQWNTAIKQLSYNGWQFTTLHHKKMKMLIKHISEINKL